MINTLKIIFSIAVVVISLQKVSGNNSNPNCDGKTLAIKTEFEIKYKYFFFRKTNHKRVKRIDEIVDENGTILMRIKMKSSESGDTNSFRKFHRLVLINKEIHEVICLTNKEFGKLIVYNFCGEKMKEVVIKSDEIYDKYRF